MKKMRMLSQRFNKKKSAENYIKSKGFKSHEVIQGEDGYWYICRVWDEDDSTRFIYNKNNFNIKEYITIAKQLCYPKEVIEKLKEAKNETQADNIMTQARLNL